jgi:serine/threonine protein kinase
MNPRHASIQAGDLDRVDRVVQLLEDEQSRHGDVELKRFWLEQQRVHAFGSVDSLGLLVELIKADLRFRFEQGQTPTVAGYLERFPELRAADTRVLSLIYEEFCLSEERGGAPNVESFFERYPDWKDSLASQLRYHRLISTAAGTRPSVPHYPNPGDDFEEFHLESLLGTGGTSRVFLARDNSLGGKQVVLKVSLDRGQEPKAQGRLDHPHIVPVNSVTFQTERQLRGLSMPYRVGLPLDEIIKRVNPAGRPRKAIALWKALVDGASHQVIPGKTDELGRTLAVDAYRLGPRGDGWQGFPVRGTFDQGVAWIVMIMARSLHYAHGMHTFHRDVKPANVLLTLQHGPQLLDFNLAESPHSADQAQAALHGGTLPYMAPEQIAAFLDPELWGKVEAKADIYSLGLVFRELLTGVMPELPPETLSPQRALRNVFDRRPFLEVSVRRLNPTIPHSLDAIVAKCLALSPDDRYADAQAVVQDLDRFLKHKPLVNAVNPSRRERLGNWVKRHRRALAEGAAILIVAAALLYRPIAERLKPPIESLRDFQSAILLLDDEEEEVKPALDLLRKLKSRYPESALLLFYLSFAFDAYRNDYDANDQFNLALNVPGAKEMLVAWAKDHPGVVAHLEDFAKTRFKFADDHIHKFEFDEIVDDTKAKKLKEPYYELAREALLLAVKMNPGSRKAHLHLAKAEDFFGNYDSAFKLVSYAIDIPRSSDDVDDGDIIQSCFAQRCGIETHWAAELRRDGSLEATREALKHIKRAQQDLITHRNSVSSKNSTGDRHKVHEYLEMEIDAMLASGEIEIDLELPTEAKQHLDRARKAIRELIEHARSTELAPPNTSPMNGRLSKGMSRLRNLGVGSPPAADGQHAKRG